MVANEETFDENSSSEANYKEQYKEMKRKLRLLIYVSYYKPNWSIICAFTYKHIYRIIILFHRKMKYFNKP